MPSPVSASEGDPRREALGKFQWSPSKRLIKAIRDYQAARDSGSPLAMIARKLAVLRHRFWSAVSGADIPLNSNIGVGVVIPHPSGVVIHPQALIGPNCMIFQQVTVGVADGEGAPRIGGHVDIGAGAKVLGNIRIGDHARIGANAVVLDDVLDHQTVVGIPARPVSPRR
jgi:serine O-acetyltransferase